MMGVVGHKIYIPLSGRRHRVRWPRWATTYISLSGRRVIIGSCVGPRVYFTFLENTGHSLNAVSMLGQRRRRWANIETALGECPVFVGLPISQCKIKGAAFCPGYPETPQFGI